ncbi:hypothetical protein HYZ97_05195 [Candidatus Pacearchaeota archaeon]|nr:hypothetical protein [Candidatus Pacearchaeota archaeon]
MASRAITINKKERALVQAFFLRMGHYREVNDFPSPGKRVCELSSSVVGYPLPKMPRKDARLGPLDTEEPLARDVPRYILTSVSRNGKVHGSHLKEFCIREIGLREGIWSSGYLRYIDSQQIYDLSLEMLKSVRESAHGLLTCEEVPNSPKTRDIKAYMGTSGLCAFRFMCSSDKENPHFTLQTAGMRDELRELMKRLGIAHLETLLIECPVRTKILRTLSIQGHCYDLTAHTLKEMRLADPFAKGAVPNNIII